METMESSSNPDPALPSDVSQRFIFDDADIRGETVHLDGALQGILAVHQYAPGVSQLIGEFLAAAVLLSTTLKFEGKLILQARSEGQIPLIMVECSNELQIRAIVRGAEQATSTRFGQLLSKGQLAITVDPTQGKRYQSIVPLVEDSLAHSLDAYFEQSEQLATRFWLAADQHRAGGMLLQQLPTQNEADKARRAGQWQHACALAATVNEEELLELHAEQLLHRLYHENPVRLFEPSPVAFQCSCSRERTLNALASIDRVELQEILNEQGNITMDCEFCNQQYQYNREDLTAMLSTENTAAKSRTLH
jgi:molecular chaperone Hsp33